MYDGGVINAHLYFINFNEPDVLIFNNNLK